MIIGADSNSITLRTDEYFQNVCREIINGHAANVVAKMAAIAKVVWFV
ncbi:MAG: hypothetical protein WAZ77_19340 [Candidatus Nitrosopolaris sp.]